MLRNPLLIDKLHTWSTHDGLGNPAIQLMVPLGVGTEAEGQAFHANFDNAAECIAGPSRLVNQLLDLFVLVRIERVNDALITEFPVLRHVSG